MNFLFAHAFGQSYALPVPLWLFLFAASAVVLLSFVVFVLLLDKKETPESKTSKVHWKNLSFLAPVGKVASILLLIIAITSDWTNIGVLGFSVTFFWIILLLGFTYFTAIFGNWWEVINPFKAIFEGLEKLARKPLKPLMPYPKGWSYWPALITYYGLIWLELLSAGFGVRPSNISRLLLSYTLVTLFYTYIFGKEVWFKYGEFFSVFFRLVSKVSPIRIKEEKFSLVKPFSQLIDVQVKNFSLLLFIIFMLASTGYDGFRETVAFRRLSGSLPDFATSNFQLYQSIFLAISPLLLLSIYFLILWLVKRTVSTPFTTLDLAKKFSYSLLPIAVAYNAAHYFSLLFLEAPTMIGYLLDPFDLGWSSFQVYSSPLGASTIWYTQVFLIVAGHVAAVYVAHKIALRLFKDQKEALKSQYLMLLLMIFYTMGSLWIIGQPLTIR